MNPIVQFLTSAIFSFGIFALLAPTFLLLARTAGLYTVVREREAKVYIILGKVAGVISEPGLHILPFEIGPSVFLLPFLGKCLVVDLRLDQSYLKSNPVNSEEGAPMGIGIWYEMKVQDPVAYLFKNSDPEGSLSANVGNSTTRCLSNMPLATMLGDRHKMSNNVRDEVAAYADEWGYSLGAVYIRKVHFRDSQMIRQIEEKVVNRLRQVTSAIKQDGANQVSIISSQAEQEAAAEFAKAGAVRPKIVGDALGEIGKDKEVAAALFEVLETQKLLEGGGKITLIPEGEELLCSLLAAEGTPSNNDSGDAPSLATPNKHPLLKRHNSGGL